MAKTISFNSRTHAVGSYVGAFLDFALTQQLNLFIISIKSPSSIR